MCGGDTFSPQCGLPTLFFKQLFLLQINGTEGIFDLKSIRDVSSIWQVQARWPQGRVAQLTPTNRCYRASSTFIFFYYHVLRYLHSRAFFYCWKNLYTFLLILSMEKQQNQQKLIKVRRVREIQKRNLQNYFGHLRHWPTILEQNCTISGRWNRIGEETCKVRKKWKITPNYSNQF